MFSCRRQSGINREHKVTKAQANKKQIQFLHDEDLDLGREKRPFKFHSRFFFLK